MHDAAPATSPGTADPHSYPGRDLEAMLVAHNYTGWILSEFRGHFHGRVAEVGAGSGTFTERLLDEDVDSITAYEPSPEMHEKLARRFAGNPRVTTVPTRFEAPPGDGALRFDAIFYVNVLEHIEDDAAELATIASALRPGGALLLFVPALPFLYSRFDREIGHFRRYRKRALRTMVERAGFSVSACRYFDVLGVLPWYVSFVLLRSGMNRGAVTLYDRVGVPLTRAVEALCAPPLGKNLLLVATKPA